MSYASTIDFLGLFRQTSGGVRALNMPGLDYVVSALSRSGMLNLFVGQSAPIINQSTTAWFKPSVPSTVAEGTLYLWNPSTTQYEPATPALWRTAIAGSGYLFQSVAVGAAVITGGVSLLAIQRAAPAATFLTLPSIAAQFASGLPLRIVDWSSGVTNHAITLTPSGGTIMRLASFKLTSTADQLASVTLIPSPDLNGWVIT